MVEDEWIYFTYEYTMGGDRIQSCPYKYNVTNRKLVYNNGMGNKWHEEMFYRTPLSSPEFKMELRKYKLKKYYEN